MNIRYFFLSMVIVNAICRFALAQTSPPQIAIDACNGQSEGSSCSFTLSNGTESGLCAMIASQIACVPNTSNSEESTTVTEPGTVIGNTNNKLPDTGQTGCYDGDGIVVSCPASGEGFYGQDAQYSGNAMSYTNHNDGTITDNVTGIMWQQTTDRNGDGNIDANDKLGYTEAISYCDNLTLAGYSDWQLPNITQLYSLMYFDGMDMSNYTDTDTTSLIPFIDTAYFEFGYGDTEAGERLIDAQYASSTLYVSTTMNNAETMFGLNLADGRIKGYPTANKTYYVQCARNIGSYGQNSFTDNGDGTITDSNTGLIWAHNDSAAAMDWEETLAWVVQQNSANYLGYNDWRLPNIKELQSLVDYSRSPDTHESAAIDPLFNATAITNEAGQTDYPYYWSSTTHINSSQVPGANAAYISFGRAIGSMDSGSTWIDVHGAGAQRSDPKITDNPSDYPNSHGPQGDAQRVFNYARLVRDASHTENEAYFDANSELLYIPTVEVGELGLYKVTLHFIGMDSRYTPGFLFELTEAVSVTGTSSATYNTETGLLTLPSVVVGDTVYVVEMILVPDEETMRFAVTALL